jgi:hypothetical protein
MHRHRRTLADSVTPVTRASVSIRQHTSAYVIDTDALLPIQPQATQEHPSGIRQHTSAYVSIRHRHRRTLADSATGDTREVCIRTYEVSHGCKRSMQEKYAYLRMRCAREVCIRTYEVSLLYAYVHIRQHASAYVSIRQHTPACVSIREHT